ncbi:hypothetical protein B0F90DRAFT_1710492 [Multifurca ochricompacta]|uniref:F-box domain-containing protein n=1 Tax=Multifurca ochricompacta TaxID=376703 RepID=A0AAD4QLZ5_9AGAM|nr:hypothetical protein B0F90DRAFT_1710492 [Multifurca ochricompacta]
MDNVFYDIDSQLSLYTDPRHAQSLKYFRNSLVPVSRLPNILLTHIFTLLLNDSQHIYHQHTSPTCLHVSHVCRTWRDAALHCSLLWTNILFRPPEWTAIMLERSRTAPLTIEVLILPRDFANTAFLNSVRLALSHIRHIRYLCIILLDRCHDLGDLLSFFPSESPSALEELTLSSHSDFPIYTFPSFESASQLRSLDLNRCHINWQMFSSLGNLTSLVLKDIPIISRPSIDNILFILRSMSNLEKLALIHAIPELPTSIRTLPPTPGITPIKLERLSHLSLAGFVLDCVNVMRHFIMPRCKQVNLRAESRWRLPEVTLAISPLANIISSIFSEHYKQEIPYLGSINWTPGNAISIIARPASTASCPVIDVDEPFLDLSLSWCYSRHQGILETSPGFGTLLLSLPLGRIVEFSVSLSAREEYIEIAEWLKVIICLSRVETVILSGGCTYGFVIALHTAHVSNLPSSNGPSAQELFSTLTGSLTRRRQLGWSIPSIRLVSCYITPPRLAVLNTLASGPVECIGEPETWGVGELDSGSSDEDTFGGDDED